VWLRETGSQDLGEPGLEGRKVGETRGVRSGHAETGAWVGACGMRVHVSDASGRAVLCDITTQIFWVKGEETQHVISPRLCKTARRRATLRTDTHGAPMCPSRRLRT
jgi:hypothetical protein